jgi:hypothetical protein
LEIFKLSKCTTEGFEFEKKALVLGGSLAILHSGTKSVILFMIDVQPYVLELNNDLLDQFPNSNEVTDPNTKRDGNVVYSMPRSRRKFVEANS